MPVAGLWYAVIPIFITPFEILLTIQGYYYLPGPSRATISIGGSRSSRRYDDMNLLIMIEGYSNRQTKEAIVVRAM